MEPNPGLIPSEVSLKRYLHYGSESALCLPGDRFFLQCFLPEKLSAIERMLSDCAPGKEGDAVSHILKCFTDGYSGHPECIMFALAVCAHQKCSVVLRNQAFSAVKTICKSSKDIFLFVTFMKKLSPPTKGHGGGWRRAVSQWYLSKEPLDLAECVTRVRGAYGFTHRDLIKLCHLKADDPGKSAVICYLMKGLEAAKMQFSGKSEAAKVLAYLQVVDETRHQTDPKTCAALLEHNNLSVDIVQHNLLKSAEVWNALLPTIPLRFLLESLVRLSCNGLLRPGLLLEKLIVDRLLDQTAIVESQIHPTEVFCALRRYENHAKNAHEFLGKLAKQGQFDNKLLKPPPKPNKEIISALNKLVDSTLKLLVPTGMKYLLAIDLSSNMKTWKCNGSRDVTPAQAAALLALCLLHAEREVTVTTFTPVPGAPPEEDLIDPANPITHEVPKPGKSKRPGQGVVYPRAKELKPMVSLTLDKNISVFENVDKLSETCGGPVQLSEPIVWAQESNKAFDVFIVITDHVTKRKRELLEPAVALEDYRKHMKMPQAKLVTCALSSNTLDIAAPNDVGMLDIAGFDGNVARIIEAFARGAF